MANENKISHYQYKSPNGKTYAFEIIGDITPQELAEGILSKSGCLSNIEIGKYLVEELEASVNIREIRSQHSRLESEVQK